MEMAPTDLVSCCNPFSWMLHDYYVLPRGFLPLISLSFFNPHPSNRVSFSHLTSLRSSLVSSALARLWSFTGAHVFPFPIRSDKIARVGGGIRSRVLPKECRPFFPKTTVSGIQMIIVQSKYSYDPKSRFIRKPDIWVCIWMVKYGAMTLRSRWHWVSHPI